MILAGITLVYVFGDNGVFQKAQDAKDKTEQAKKDEQEYFNNLDNTIDKYVNGNGGTITPPSHPIEDIVDKIQDNNTVVQDKNGNKITVPGGFRVLSHGSQNENIAEVIYNYDINHTPCVQDGIVIADEEDNQFVWIPVGEIKNKDNTTTTITLGRYTFDTTNGTPNLEQAAYTAENPDNYTQVITIESYYQELISDSKNTSAKNLGNFVTKTKANEGYYLARYEASQGTDKKVKSQYDKTPLTNYTQQSVATNARNMYAGNNYIESDLINSYAWDTAIVFIQRYSGNSNYANKGSVYASSKNTGKADDEVCNINEMASNFYEWSTEHSTHKNEFGSYPCVRRGGTFAGDYTSLRYGYLETASSTSYSFRPILYLK